MRFSKQIDPEPVGPFTILAVVVAVGAALAVFVVGGMLLGHPSVRASLATVVVSMPPANGSPPFAPPSSTPATLAALLTDPLATVTPMLNDPRPPTNTPTSVLKATGYYSAPIDPTPIPTPALPPAAPFPASCDGPGRMNILLIGMDGRSANYGRAARADALSVVGVNFGDRTAQVLSIPRDLWVQIPAYGDNPAFEDRINVAYALGQQYGYPGGGPAFEAYTISQTFGLRIDRAVVLNFTAFEGAVDTIGGVDIDVQRAIYDPKYPDDEGGTLVLEIPAGRVHMDGRTALMYARTRHQDSDFGRIRRQQQVLMAVRDKLLTPDTLLVLPSLAQLVYQSVRTDLSLDEVGLLGCVGPKIPREAIARIAIGSEMVEAFTAPSGAAVLRPKMDVILPLLEGFSVGQ